MNRTVTAKIELHDDTAAELIGLLDRLPTRNRDDRRKLQGLLVALRAARHDGTAETFIGPDGGTVHP